MNTSSIQLPELEAPTEPCVYGECCVFMPFDTPLDTASLASVLVSMGAKDVARVITYLERRLAGHLAYTNEYRWSDVAKNEDLIKQYSVTDTNDFIWGLEMFNAENAEWHLPTDVSFCALAIVLRSDDFLEKSFHDSVVRELCRLTERIGAAIGARTAFASFGRHLYTYCDIMQLSATQLTQLAPWDFVWPFAISIDDTEEYEAFHDQQNTFLVDNVKVYALVQYFSEDSVADMGAEVASARRCGLQSLLDVPLRWRCEKRLVLSDDGALLEPDPVLPGLDMIVHYVVEFATSPIRLRPCPKTESVTICTEASVSTLDLRTGTRELIVSSGALFADWSSNGQMLFLQSNEECAADLFLVHTSHQLVVNIAHAPDLGYESSTSRQGREGSVWEPRPRCSPNGAQVVFCRPRLTVFRPSERVQYDEADIWLLDVASGAISKIIEASNGELLLEPTIGPSGDVVAYVSIKDNNCSSIRLMALATRKTRELARSNQMLFHLEWHPDGNHLSFVLSAGVPLPNTSYYVNDVSGVLSIVRCSDGALGQLEHRGLQPVWVSPSKMAYEHRMKVEGGLQSTLRILEIDLPSICVR